MQRGAPRIVDPQPSSSQAQPSSSQQEMEDEEALSGTGEGDEVMEEEEAVEAEAEGYASSTPTSSLTWITWFCSLPGHEYFCEVSEEFIEDDFNLTGLNSMVPFWREALEMVLDVEPEDTQRIPDVSIVEASAELLYGLVHQRYIITRAGLQAMVEKYDAGQFGTCPRVYCVATHVVPCGRSDLPGLDTVKLYCPNCHDLYTPPSSRFQDVDGAFFGTTFAHLFFLTYRELAPAPYYSPTSASNAITPRDSPGGTSSNSNAARQVASSATNYGGQRAPAGRVYTSKIYGFRVSELARCGPRMRWLRMRPETATELDSVDWRGKWIGGDDFEDDDGQLDADRPEEEFDPDHAEGDDDEEEEEEEEEEEGPSSVVKGAGSMPKRRQEDRWTTANDYEAPPSPRPPTPIPKSASMQSLRTAVSSTSVDTPRDEIPMLSPPSPFVRNKGSIAHIFSKPASRGVIAVRTTVREVA